MAHDGKMLSKSSAVSLPRGAAPVNRALTLLKSYFASLFLLFAIKMMIGGTCLLLS
jgi:hypothetical protein